MTVTDKQYVLRLMGEVRNVVQEQMTGGDQGIYGRGISTEGFAGGYAQALDDVEAALRHGKPSDPRGYWARARRRMAETSHK